MGSIKDPNKVRDNFYLNKWFLDCVSEYGEAMIFYAARLKWHSLEVPYTSWLRHDPATGTSQRSRFHNIQIPEMKDQSIYWKDTRFQVEGKWETQVSPIQVRLYESEEGYLDWNCFQPSSSVSITNNGKTMKGTGYVEQLILTVEPWKIPMKELRWGRFISREDHLVWIELKNGSKKQWLWHNGEKVKNATIEDSQIMVPAEGLVLRMDRNVVLESEKKILQVVGKLIRYLPGFNKSVPFRFLMADEYKWLSHGTLLINGEPVSKGWAIHEYVNFNHQ